MCRAVNEATIGAFAEGVVRSTTLMAPWPGAGQAMGLLREHPEIPFGVHLTVVCDMPDYRWGPLTRGDKVPSLIDDAGNFHGLERLPEVVVGARLDELELEFRAQIEAVLTGGLRPTHLDWHCLHNGGSADVFDLTLGLAREYGLALRVSDLPAIERLQGRGLPTLEHELLDSYALDPSVKAATYARLLRELPIGLSEWAVHPGLAGREDSRRECDDAARQGRGVRLSRQPSGGCRSERMAHASRCWDAAPHGVDA
jgi:predicted glycoside hydrolase/deacetylase ChbG (UPF0249 family)